MNKLNMFFTNKGVEIINLPVIRRSKNRLSKMPPDMPKDNIPVVAYELQQLSMVESKYSTIKSLQNLLTLTPLSKNETILPCHCENPP